MFTMEVCTILQAPPFYMSIHTYNKLQSDRMTWFIQHTGWKR